MKNLLKLFLVGIFSAVISVAAFNKFGKTTNETKVIVKETSPSSLTKLDKTVANLTADGFVTAAHIATPAVVHIQTTTKAKATKQNINPFWEFFGDQYDSGPQLASGSGVIITADGYIATNNHVVEDADEITVTLNDKREYKAVLIGTDPNTDLAVIKINDKSLEHLSFANSDEVQVGEWVLAVGNPFNLASTVTAGIVSAKGRNINILREKAGNVAIESFIQTDAAVNPGNSGGALVDLNGNLVGINTAIATPTGTFAGYSFAVPSNLVKKVVNDMIDYGVVQRGYMGVSITSLTAEQAEEFGIDDIQGVLVSEIVEGSGADDAGILPGDVITKINGITVKSSPELQELVGTYSPGDKINVEFVRKNKTENKDVTLKSRDNGTSLITKKSNANASKVDLLGAVFEELTPEEARNLKIRGGVKVKKIKDGILEESTQMKAGFVITKVNNRPVYSISELEEVLNGYTGDGVLVEGKYPGISGTKYYAFGM
ncbi:MAG: Do family serine endopeptidase [Chitinophagales bacterium]